MIGRRCFKTMPPHASPCRVEAWHPGKSILRGIGEDIGSVSAAASPSAMSQTREAAKCSRKKSATDKKKLHGRLRRGQFARANRYTAHSGVVAATQIYRCELARGLSHPGDHRFNLIGGVDL